jgi:hypothetical protein
MRDVVVRNYHRVYYIYDRNFNMYLHTDGVWRQTTGHLSGRDTGLFTSFLGAVVMASLWGCNITETREAPPEYIDPSQKFFRGLLEEVDHATGTWTGIEASPEG